jgi:lipopolysaccharide export system protein LptA
MGMTKLRTHHTLKFISTGMFVVVLIALAISFLTRSKRQLQVPEIAAELNEQKIDKKEGLEVRVTRGDKENIIIEGDKHYFGEDNLYHLEGNVRIYLPGRIQGEDVVILGENVIYNSEMSYFWLQGQSTVEFKDLVVESTAFEYDRQKSIFRTDQTIQFISEAISGSAQSCDYFLEQKKAEMLGEVHLKILPSQETLVPVEVDTEYFEYFIGKGRGKAEGGVELTHGKSHATAGLLEFALSASRKQIKSFFLKGKVKIALVDEFPDVESLSDQTTLALYGDRCLMDADEILIRGYVDLPQIKGLEATGDCTFKFISEKGSFTQIEGEEIAFDLTGDGNLKSLVVNRDVKISEEDKEKGSPRYIEGQKVQVLRNKNLLLVEGKDTLKARIWSEDSEITAQEITIFLESNNMEARRDTKVIIYPDEKSQDVFGFFSEENPIFITTTEMRFIEGKKRYRFSGETKIWQMKETIKAEEMSMSAETGTLWARGNVESVLPYRPKDKEEDSLVRIESSAVEYDPEKSMIVYKDNVKLKTNDVVLSAKLLMIALEKESGDMVNIEAHDHVAVVKKPYEGHGDEANFDVKEEVITVVGNPVFIDKDKGKMEGGKLTFYMADGRIVVENKDRERSVTYIKF